MKRNCPDKAKIPPRTTLSSVTPGTVSLRAAPAASNIAPVSAKIAPMILRFIAVLPGVVRRAAIVIEEDDEDRYRGPPSIGIQSEIATTFPFFHWWILIPDAPVCFCGE